MVWAATVPHYLRLKLFRSSRYAVLGVVGIFALLALTVTNALAFPTTTVGDYLLVGRGETGTAIGVKVGSSNTLGSIGPVPSGTNPDVKENPPWPLPAGAMHPVEGV